MAYALRQIEPRDRDALLRLWRDNLATLADSAVGPPRYSWAYERHPHGGPFTVLAENSNHEVIGCGSLYPRTIHAANLELDDRDAVGFCRRSQASHRRRGADDAASPGH